MIIMVGVPGSGKSFFAEKFAATFHAPYVSRDKIALIIDDQKAIDRLFALQLTELLKTNHSIIVEGPAVTRAERTSLSKAASAAGYETLFLWVQIDPATAKNRSTKLAKDTHRTPLTSDQHEALVKRFSPPHPLEKPVVISGKHTYATQVKVVLKKLSAPRAEVSTNQQPPARRQQTTRRSITVS
jgi:predicted kinase